MHHDCEWIKIEAAPPKGAFKCPHCLDSGLARDPQRRSTYIPCPQCSIFDERHPELAAEKPQPTIDSPPLHSAPQVISQAFVERMAAEIIANTPAKGDFAKWQPTHAQAMGELYHHVSKLDTALLKGSDDQVQEYATDIANICMNIFNRRPPTP